MTELLNGTEGRVEYGVAPRGVIRKFMAVQDMDEGIEKAAATDEDMEAISHLIPAGAPMPNREDVAIFEVRAANNAVDRDRDRFTVKLLETFAQSAPRKPNIHGHGRPGPGVGRIIKAAVKKGTLTMPDGTVVTQVERSDGKMEDVRWLSLRLYLNRQVTPDLVKAIEAGIVFAVSIGAGVRNMTRVAAEDDTLKFMEMDAPGELYEVSWVWLGSQFGAESDGMIRGIKAFGKEAGPDIAAELSREMRFAMGSDVEWTEEGAQAAIEMAAALANEIAVFGSVEHASKAVWSTAYINRLADVCFAAIEKGAKKDDSGRSIPRTARHLPHHNSTTATSHDAAPLDIPHLRDADDPEKAALSRVNQVKSVLGTESDDALRQRARRHLAAHASDKGLGDHSADHTHEGGEDRVDLKIKGLGEGGAEKSFNIGPENLDAGLAEVKTAVETAIAETGQALEKAAKDTKAAEDALKTEQEATKALREVLGENAEPEKAKTLVKAAADGAAYRAELIEDALRLGGLLGAIGEASKAVMRTHYEAMETKQLVEVRDAFRKDFDEKYPLPGKLNTPDTEKGRPQAGAGTVASDALNYGRPGRLRALPALHLEPGR